VQGQRHRGTDCQSDIFRAQQDLPWRDTFWPNIWSFWVIMQYSQLLLKRMIIFSFLVDGTNKLKLIKGSFFSHYTYVQFADQIFCLWSIQACQYSSF
jgi:hypothetical protein